MALTTNDRERLANICPANQIAKMVFSASELNVASGKTQIKASLDVVTGLSTVCGITGTVIGTSAGNVAGNVTFRHAGTAGTVTILTWDMDDGAAAGASSDVVWLAWGL